MHDVPNPRLRRAVASTLAARDPDFSRVYRESSARNRRWWTKVAVATLSASAALILGVVLVQPPPTPGFTHQVAAFVDLVYRD